MCAANHFTFHGVQISLNIRNLLTHYELDPTQPLYPEQVIQTDMPSSALHLLAIELTKISRTLSQSSRTQHFASLYARNARVVSQAMDFIHKQEEEDKHEVRVNNSVNEMIALLWRYKGALNIIVKDPSKANQDNLVCIGVELECSICDAKECCLKAGAAFPLSETWAEDNITSHFAVLYVNKAFKTAKQEHETAITMCNNLKANFDSATATDSDISQIRILESRVENTASYVKAVSEFRNMYVRFLDQTSKSSNDLKNERSMVIASHFNIIELATTLSVKAVAPLPFFI